MIECTNKITALYSRLSVGDEDRDGGESNSIVNQKAFLERYARQHKLMNIRHYIDDDESGKFFDRSAYTQMISDVEQGKIGIVIMKDMTRWGRDYLQVGNAMEIFRRNNVRFIAINNGIDSKDQNTLDFAPFINIMSIGYGTWQSPDSDVTVTGVKIAVGCGYRHIDAAAVYGNEVSVGKGIAECGIPREELFITSKVWNTERGYNSTLAAFEKTVRDLGCEYLDLYLIHWPAAAHMFANWEQINLDTWRAMTELYRAGKIKAIGVSNFKPHHLEALMKTEVKPMVNQIEFHPGLLQGDTVKYCRKNDILVEAWSPLGTGRMLDNAVLKDIALRNGKSVAQICIRWCIQHDVPPLPKSVTPERIEENVDVFDFELAEDDMKIIDELENFGGSGLDPDKVDF